MATEYELTLSDYLSILRIRAPYLIGIFVVVLLISFVVAFAIPPAYRATGTIMVESQQVSDNILPGTIRSQLDDQVNVIMQQVMTRDNLLRLADKYNIFSNNMVPSVIVGKMRDKIDVEIGDSTDSLHINRQGQQAISFTLSFEDRRPEIALQVTNELINLFLDTNVKLRNEGAAETTDFLNQESTKLKLLVEGLEQKITRYKSENSNALPEQLTLRMTMLDHAQNDLLEVERDIRSTKEDIRSLGVELSAARSGMSEGNSNSAQAQSLPALRDEYARLSAVYQESYPDLRILKRKIEALEKSLDTPVSGINSTDASSLAVYKIQTKISSDNARLNSLAQQREMLQAKIAENERAMLATPKVEQGLDVLIRDRDTAQRKFEEIRNKQMNAQIAQSLQSGNKSGSFSVLEPPLLPEKPFKPDRVKILVLGFFLAIFSSGGGIMVLETINKRIRGNEALAHALGHQPLVVIPYLPIQEERVRRKRMLKLAIIAAVVVVTAAAVALYFLNKKTLS